MASHIAALGENQQRVLLQQTIMELSGGNVDTEEPTDEALQASQEHKSLKYSLLGPSLLKAGQDAVDQRKVSHFCLRSTGHIC